MRRKLVFVWVNLADYHLDRLRAVQDTLPKTDVVCIELASKTSLYDWGRPDMRGVRVITLHQGEYESIPLWRRMVGLLRCLWRERPQVGFFCHYERPEILLAALLLRLMGGRAAIMNETALTDRPRRLWRECLKVFFLLPYTHGVMSGAAAAAYLHFFGFSPQRVHGGYSTLSLDRLRDLAGSAGQEIPFDQRPLVVVNRLVADKNMLTVLQAYAQYRALQPTHPRPLLILGNGQQEDELRAWVAAHQVPDVRFLGFVDQTQVARHLARALCLVLFSRYETWGLVVNEALALGVPVVVSDRVGARELLVRHDVNGAVLETDNVQGLAQTLARLSDDEDMWRRWSQGGTQFQAAADCPVFARSVMRVAEDQPTQPLIPRGWEIF